VADRPRRPSQRLDPHALLKSRTDARASIRFGARSVARGCRSRVRLACALVLLPGCTSHTLATPKVSPSPLSRQIPSSSSTPAVGLTEQPSCADQVFDSMTEGQRIGQLFVLGLPGDRLTLSEVAAIRAYHVGSVSFVSSTSVGVRGIRAVADAVQALVNASTTANVRFFVAANQEGGLIQPLQGSGFSRIPSALAQGAMDPATLETRARQWGRELASAGVNIDFAPVLDVVPPGTEDQNRPIGVLQREYGGDPAAVALHGLAFLRGMEAAGIVTVAKHFPGLGRVAGNTDFTAGVVDTATTDDDPYLQPFAQAIDIGVPFVMVALAEYTRIDSHHRAIFSSIVMQRILRRTLHFNGVIISDELGVAAQVSDIPPGRRAVAFLESGGDMVVSKHVDPAVEMYRSLIAQTESSLPFRNLAERAVRRVLRAKQDAGLLPCESS